MATNDNRSHLFVCLSNKIPARKLSVTMAANNKRSETDLTLTI